MISNQDKFSEKTVTSKDKKFEKKYGFDHRKEKHITRDEIRSSSYSENCDSEIEKSEVSFKVENKKSDNAESANSI